MSGECAQCGHTDCFGDGCQFDLIPNYSESCDNCDTYRGGLHSALCSKLQRLEAERDELRMQLLSDQTQYIEDTNALIAERDKYKAKLEEMKRRLGNCNPEPNADYCNLVVLELQGYLMCE